MIASLSFIYRNHYHSASINNGNIERLNNVRTDVVENNKPEKHTVTLLPPPLYLDIKRRNNINVSATNNLLRRHHDDSIDNNSTSSTNPPTLRWGIVGAGRIAHDFTAALLSSGCTVTAVATMNNLSHAQTFATSNSFSIPNFYGTYEELAQDDNVDIVYVATTNQNHLYPTMLMLQSGKNVLVEKPTAVTFAEAKMMYDEAHKRGLFLMTNHWTRFFPLVKFLRTNFLEDGQLMMVGGESKKNWKMGSSPTYNHHRPTLHNLGRVLAMHGDFGFRTPLNQSDRFLNKTLGGGVTLDVGCYLVELALLAAYDYHQTRSVGTVAVINNAEGKKKNRRGRKLTSDELLPDQIIATGHGMYGGFEFPVDVESSFSLRWGGKNYGIWNGDCSGVDDGGGGDADDMTAVNKRRGCKSEASISQTSPGIAYSADEFTMVASFQASFRRPSTFEVEYSFENGRIVLHGPGNCPNEMTIYENEPFGPLIRETTVSFPLPNFDLSPYGRPNYPRAEGFVYVIDRIEECMAIEGIPRLADDGLSKIGSGCLELEENSIEEQLATVEITERVLREMNYFGSSTT